jgi:lipoprotein Spr
MEAPTGAGIDCSAFTAKLLAEVYGLTVARTANEQYKNSERRDLAELVEGDLVFFKKRGRIGHVGLYLGNNYFVHTSVHNGVIISCLEDEYYSKRFVSGGKVGQATGGRPADKLSYE